MSAPQIPNLLTSRGGPRLRGRGRGRSGSSTEASGPSRHDQIIQTTDTDAAVSRLSAVSMGYLEDPFARYFVQGEGTRRLPIINRGTYTRTTALDMLIDAFLDTAENSEARQIISLGAGTDTRYFRRRKRPNVLYHEFDFPAVCSTKRRTVQANLQRIAPDETVFEELEGEAPHTDSSWGLMDTSKNKKYYCHPLDLRQLSTRKSLFPGLRNDIPALIISECCLCYLPVEAADGVIEWFRDRIFNTGIVLYEPIGVSDAFGQMMVENLAARGITMPTVHRYKSLSDEKDRLSTLQFSSHGETVEEIWNTWISPLEKDRVDALEGLDEVEEWQMLARHYAIVWGWKGDSEVWKYWRKSS